MHHLATLQLPASSHDPAQNEFSQLSRNLIGSPATEITKDGWFDRKTNIACSALPLTDLGNCQRFVEPYGHRVRFCSMPGWLVWDAKEGLV